MRARPHRLTIDHGLDKVAHLGDADLDIEALPFLRHQVHRPVVLRNTSKTPPTKKKTPTRARKPEVLYLYVPRHPGYDGARATARATCSRGNSAATVRRTTPPPTPPSGMRVQPSLHKNSALQSSSASRRAAALAHPQLTTLTTIKPIAKGRTNRDIFPCPSRTCIRTTRQQYRPPPRVHLTKKKKKDKRNPTYTTAVVCPHPKKKHGSSTTTRVLPQFRPTTTRRRRKTTNARTKATRHTERKTFVLHAFHHHHYESLLHDACCPSSLTKIQ